MKIRKTETISPMMKLLSGLLSPILAAAIGIGSYAISARAQLDVTTSTVQQLKISNDKLSDEIKGLKIRQDKMFEEYYMPTRNEWMQHTNALSRIASEHEDFRRALGLLNDDVRRYHMNDTRTRSYGR